MYPSIVVLQKDSPQTTHVVREAKANAQSHMVEGQPCRRSGALLLLMLFLCVVPVQLQRKSPAPATTRLNSGCIIEVPEKLFPLQATPSGLVVAFKPHPLSFIFTVQNKFSDYRQPNTGGTTLVT